ncbi:Fatty acid export 4 protein [Thalictrum thalictroides]|uniref:Fatty acid export 4 protein n=1 Tax=Thalictrum thalictroides TaxID=46969 RepID=A0A7J6W6H5_THATH|nr:Fatty acid export 4 protein [Thalictrum thalictroides]
MTTTISSCLPAKTFLLLDSSKTNLINRNALATKKKKNGYNNRLKQQTFHQHICKAQLVLTELAPATSAVYGAILLGGGLFAYSKSNSKGSLIGGVSGGAIMATAYYLMQSPETKSFGDALAFGSAFLFSSVFVIRLVASRKLIPSGPLLGLSVGALVVFISAYMQDKV